MMIIKKDFLFHFVTTAVTLVVVNVGNVDADWSPWSSSSEEQMEAISLNKFESFWIDATDVLTDLDTYDKLWIKPHSCVWSECAVDDTDDNYMGDNRDGDEQWYQYRTQGFCANAAYSLYGQKKEDEIFPSFSGCTRRRFINSFFTYGGADNLLKSIGESPVVYNYDGDDNDGNDNGNNEDGSSSSENAVCVEIEYTGDDDDENEDGENDDNSNSGSNDNNEYSGTLGCGTDGEYIIGAFKSSSCDGNYFTGIVNGFEEYNKQHSAIGCHNIYEKDNEASVENVMMLLSNSWSCDLRMYPNGCPDPYGKKEKYDFALRTVLHGGNSQRAYLNMMLKSPLHITSWTLFAVTIMIFMLTYLVKNESRAIESKGGKNVLGYLRCIGEDIAIGWGHFRAWNALKWHAFVASIRRDSKQDRKSSTEDALGKKVDDDYASTDGSDSSYVQVDDDVENKTGKSSGVAQERSIGDGAERQRKGSGGVALQRSASTAAVGIKSQTSGSADKDKKSQELLIEEDFSRSTTWA